MTATQLGAISTLATSIGSPYGTALSSTGLSTGSALAAGLGSGMTAGSVALQNLATPLSPVTDPRINTLFGLTTTTTSTTANGTNATNSNAITAACLTKLVLDGKTQAIMYNDNANWDIHTVSGATRMANKTALWNNVVLPMMSALMTAKIGFVMEFLTEGAANWICAIHEGRQSAERRESDKHVGDGGTG